MSFANPAVTVARALTNTFAGIAPGHVLPFLLAQLVGALAGMTVTAWLLGSRPASAPIAGTQPDG
jgi:glycerol uptake facilitator-like aquaporin